MTEKCHTDQWLADVLRAEAAGLDLHEDDQQQIVVFAMKTDGSLYRLGHVTASLVLQDSVAAKALIERIKFGWR